MWLPYHPPPPGLLTNHHRSLTHARTRQQDNADGSAPTLAPEDDEGNIEYKVCRFFGGDGVFWWSAAVVVVGFLYVSPVSLPDPPSFAGFLASPYLCPPCSSNWWTRPRTDCNTW